MMRRWGIVSLFAALAGCATAQLPGQAAPDPDMPIAQDPARSDESGQTAASGALQQIMAGCAASLQTPRLDPIRDKVELIKMPNIPTASAILSNHRYPTATERKAIAVWAVLSDQCQQKIAAWQATLPVPPGFTPELAAHVRSYQVTEWQLGNEWRDLLHEGRLTYSDYAKGRNQIIEDGAQAARQYIAAAQAGNAQAMAAADASYYGRAVPAAQAFMEKVMHGTAGQATASGAPPPNGAGMMEPPPIGAHRPQPPASANGMMEPPPIPETPH
jgi:hypothetical protein